MLVEPTAPAVDPVLSLLIGAFGAALLAALAGFVGAAINSRREHSRWVREERLNAYTAFLRVTELTWPMQSKDRAVWRAHMDDMTAAVSVVHILGPDTVTARALLHLDAQLDFGGAHRKFNGVEDGKPNPALAPRFEQTAARAQITRDAFVAAVRVPLKIKNR